MAVLPIITAPDPRLKVKCQAVATVDKSVRKLIDDLLDTMYEAPGIGLAAPQVGIAKRVIVLDVAEKGAPREPHGLVNPEVVWTSDEERTYDEGCLSLPDQFAEVARPDRVRVRYLDRDGKPRELEAGGLLATCLQHEIDHLEGVLFVDHISTLRRNMILRKLTKAKKAKAAE